MMFTKLIVMTGLLASLAVTTTTAATIGSFSGAPIISRFWHRISERYCIAQPELVCFVRPTKGNMVSGVVRFRPIYRYENAFFQRCVVEVNAEVSNLSPGRHGFHIHTYGDERVNDGSSTGGHFVNPFAVDIAHGLPDDGTRHWGDFGNLIAGANGNAKYSREDSVISTIGIIGRGITIHADPDEGKAQQPTGNSGTRQASCVIGFTNPDV